ncbi:vinorine synthase-like [Senna tora]|uniref:Vinorine synthase-like n=1 Tax=Senna tora TaxID=362788 RepID=A0A834SWT0_9FABA|nr:vinorine synthase-like [Senna tora]
MEVELEVEIISRQLIKPSSPTPPHLRSFKLCLLDHLIPTPYAPIILFYPPQSHTLPPLPLLLQSLTHSLSHTLTHFYPLAGKIGDEFSIECDDEGANFIEAHVKNNCSLSQFLAHPHLVSLHKLLPCDDLMSTPKESYVGTHVSNFQVNVFGCGGIAIGICVSHRVLDGASLSNFLKVWTSEARRKEEEVSLIVKPDLCLATSLFPMKRSLGFRESSMALWGSLFRKGKCVTRRFLFRNSDITNLKSQIMKKSSSLFPTRVETVSAILWKSLMDGRQNQSQQRPSLVTHLVNLRKRINDVVREKNLRAENAIGNLLWLCFAESATKRDDDKNNNDDEIGLDALVKKLRDAISKISSIEFVEKLASDDDGDYIIEKSIRMMCDESVRAKNGEVDHLGFTSWCNFGFYEVDFGWGKPVWVSGVGFSGSVFMNLVVLVDARFGDGIEAWVSMDEELMARLEENHELMSYATLDPSPLAIGSDSL